MDKYLAISHLHRLARRYGARMVREGADVEGAGYRGYLAGHRAGKAEHQARYADAVAWERIADEDRVKRRIAEDALAHSRATCKKFLDAYVRDVGNLPPDILGGSV